jgi:hypothetical protein
MKLNIFNTKVLTNKYWILQSKIIKDKMILINFCKIIIKFRIHSLI